MAASPSPLPVFRHVPKTGVIYVMSEARKCGYREGAQDWRNFGQGQPEAGWIPGAAPRLDSLAVEPGVLEYAPVAGRDDLRTAVAEFYNSVYRRGMPSQYTAANVCIAPGGRAALTRLVAALGRVHVGHFLPDYTAYEELLDLFRDFIPIPILLDPENQYQISIDELRREIMGRGLGALLLSNPCNPTGRVLQGDTLESWVGTARELNCYMLFDEFYSHYVWGPPSSDKPLRNSAAQFVENVDSDPVVLVDGLTKNWRYPGWRISWIVGPRAVIDAVASTGSFLDGGASHPLQKAAIPLVSDQISAQEAVAIQRHFRKKMEMTLSGLQKLGMKVEVPPEGTFYVWANLESLPPPLNTGMSFFRAALGRKIITVPGDFFDINPGGRRSARFGRFAHYMRFSFGAPEEVISSGLQSLGELVSSV